MNKMYKKVKIKIKFQVSWGCLPGSYCKQTLGLALEIQKFYPEETAFISIATPLVEI